LFASQKIMQIAVFSDLHGNPYACEAVLAHIRRKAAPDVVVSAGDNCLGGSDPARVVDLLMEAGVVGVYGNTETYLYAPDELPRDDHHRRMWDRVQPVAYWTLTQLGSARMDWLGRLPFSLRYAPTGNPADDLLVTHANPADVELMLYPAPQEQVRLWGDIRQPDDDPALAAAFAGLSARTVVFGHFHYTFERNWNGVRLVDVGACSLPGTDHDPRARWSLFTWRGDWHVERFWVDYDAGLEIEALKRNDMPRREDFLRYFE
jgi:predicted phosphodiesterase